MTLILFWGAVAVIVYTYLLFPLMIFLRGALKPRPIVSVEFDHQPQVSIVIAAYNEARGIESKLKNLLSLDYPNDRMEVLIASDGSNDGTDEIVKRYEGDGVKLLSLPRVGKATALNAAVAASKGEILVFSDANSIYAPESLRALVQPFADPQVGGVAGNQRYLKQGVTSLTGYGERSYWGFDRMLKIFQSQAGNAISATGAIYAIRRQLFQTVPEGVTDDFVTSTRVIAQGYRLVFANEAAAYEPVARTSRAEFGRKVRVITRGLRAVITMRMLLNPFRYGFYAVQLFSHKILRRLVVIPLLVLLLTSPLLWQMGRLYQVATIAQIGFYSCAMMGLLVSGTRLGRVRLFTLPFFFCMVNTAALIAIINVLRGHRIDRWEPQRQETSDRGAPVRIAVQAPPEQSSS